jgi:putative transposase
MSRVPLSVRVAPRDQIELHKLLGSGIQPVRVVLRALALLHLAEGTTAPATAAALKKLTSKAVRAIAHRYLQGGLERALYEKQRPGAAPLLETAERQASSPWSAPLRPRGRLAGRFA